MPRALRSSSGQTFEQCMKRLEQIVSQLERGDISLEESIKIYEEGVLLSRQCMDRLNQAELKLKTLTENAEGTFRSDDEETDDE